MGCISYYCNGCGDSIKDEEGVVLFLMQEGRILEEMQGKYNNYGATSENDWATDWSIVCRLHWSPDGNSGLAAFHVDCWDGKMPDHKSSDDPNQGCGDVTHPEAKEVYHLVHAKALLTKSPLEIEREQHLEEMGDRLSKLIEKADEIIARYKKEYPEDSQ